MEVRISRADGSFYVRDAPASSSSSSNVDDDPFYGRIVLGLFGERVPNHVARFLEYVDVPYDVDTPLPSYSRSKFVALDASTGLLIGGTNRPATNSAPSAVAAGGAEFGALASGVFAAQRRVFRDAARTFGDSRLDKVYDGKLLRRIEVTKVGTL
ncbi:hypothetical protein ACHAW5_009638 [Stephanodiscus triporus]|uniref:Uncharacterized protein n=1 Tax=Stephanodiscus triporus TaxID=2934178 RepID=A0ABD3NAC2_9STRA